MGCLLARIDRLAIMMQVARGLSESFHKGSIDPLGNRLGSATITVCTAATTRVGDAGVASLGGSQ